MKAKHPFERLSLTKEQALDLFSENPHKVRIIETKIGADEATSVYKVGDFIDLCTGPHLPHTGLVRALKLTKNSAIHTDPDADGAVPRREGDLLQRIYGISFPEKAELKEYIRVREEALKRDHRLIGRQQDLFFWNTTYAPGSTFFLPHGTIIYNKLVGLIRSELARFDYKEVKTPNMYNLDLFKVSGHYTNYKDDLYLFPSG